MLDKTAASSETARTSLLHTCEYVTVISVVPMGIGREQRLRHVMKRGGHCCVDRLEYFFIVCLDGRRKTTGGL